MHTVIMNPSPGLEVDHINGDGLDNRKSNLRICTRSQNLQCKRKTSKKTSSKFKGVHWNSKCKKWITQIMKNGVLYRYRSDSEIEAAAIYDRAASILFGGFARLNF